MRAKLLLPDAVVYHEEHKGNESGKEEEEPVRDGVDKHHADSKQLVFTRAFVFSIHTEPAQVTVFAHLRASTIFNVLLADNHCVIYVLAELQLVP